MKINRIIQGDCLTEHERIDDGSVDLILCDPPYGAVEGLGDGVSNHGMKGKTAWDTALNPVDLFDIANRILRRNGKLVLFSQEPYTSRLITEAIPNLPFGYRMIWEKDHFANSLIAKKAPVSYFEDILVFSKLGGLENSGINANHPLKHVFNKALENSGKTKRFFIDLVGSSASHYFTDGMQFRIPTKEHFALLSESINLEHSYEELRSIDAQYKEKETERHYKECPSVFNLPPGAKYKSNILRYKKDYDGFHPTQKPVALLEDLIYTYSNEGDHVADLTMGSGSTGVAAANLGRRFTGIEMDSGYFSTAKRRIDAAT